MSEAITEMVVVARGMASPRALVRGEVVAIFGPRTNEDISSMLGLVAANVDRPLGQLWVDLCWPNVLGGLVIP